MKIKITHPSNPRMQFEIKIKREDVATEQSLFVALEKGGCIIPANLLNLSELRVKYLKRFNAGET